jgi:hypothetical protein
VCRGEKEMKEKQSTHTATTVVKVNFTQLIKLKRLVHYFSIVQCCSSVQNMCPHLVVKATKLIAA